MDDQEPPVLPQAPSDQLVQSIAEVPEAVELVAQDDCGGEMAVLPTETTNGGSGARGDALVITRTWSFVDACGNVALTGGAT